MLFLRGLFDRLFVAGAVVAGGLVSYGASDTDASVLQTLTHERDLGVTPVVGRCSAQADFHEGARVEVVVDVQKLQFFDLETGDAIR